MFKSTGFQSISDFSIWANYNKILLLMDMEEGTFIIHLAYFKRDEEIVKNALYNYLPITIQVEHYVVPNQIKYDQKTLIEYTENKIL